MTKEYRKLIQEAKEFMISEPQKHPKTWRGMTTEEWMVAFSKEQINQLMEAVAEEIRRKAIRKSKEL